MGLIWALVCTQLIYCLCGEFANHPPFFHRGASPMTVGPAGIMPQRLVLECPAADDAMYPEHPEHLELPVTKHRLDAAASVAVRQISISR